MFVNDAEHWWIKQGNVEVGMGPDANGGSRWHPIPGGAELDHGNRSQQDGVSCDDVVNVDEKCVAESIRPGAEGRGASLGTYLPGNTCQQWVNEVLNKCSGGDYVIKTDSPIDYERWYHPWGIDTEFVAKPVDGVNYTAGPSPEPPPPNMTPDTGEGPTSSPEPPGPWYDPLVPHPIAGDLWE